LLAKLFKAVLLDYPQFILYIVFINVLDWNKRWKQILKTRKHLY